jgi:[NiFe] hydrogenase diaphorase moiety small subunit
VRLCVRASHDVDGKDVFAIGGHGIGTAPGGQQPSGRLGDSAMASTDRAAHICPVGAILHKRQGFAVPIGERRYDTTGSAARGGSRRIRAAHAPAT